MEVMFINEISEYFILPDAVQFLLIFSFDIALLIIWELCKRQKGL